ncbi:MAG: hypothetical protein ACKVQQ_07980 [Burkholderiales bacterium]
MKAALAVVLPFVLVLGACSTYTTPRYSINADTNVGLKSLGVVNIGVGAFSGPASFDNFCRGAGPLAPPDGLTHTEYLRKSFEDELKVAGAHGATSPRVVLTGVVSKLEFSSSRGLTGGSWDIDLTLSSSNGKKLSAAERYEFQSGFIADTACKQTAEAFLPTVQNLIKKIIQMPDFKALVQ